MAMYELSWRHHRFSKALLYTIFHVYTSTLKMEFLKIFTLKEFSKRPVFSDLKRSLRLDKRPKRREKATCTCGPGLRRAYLNLKAWIHSCKCVLTVIILKGHWCNDEGLGFGYISCWIWSLVQKTSCIATVGFIRLQFICFQFKMFSIMHTI